MQESGNSQNLAGVEVTGFFTVYFKTLSKYMRYWQEKSVIKGQMTRTKPLFKDSYMDMLSNFIPSNLKDSVEALDKLDPVLGPAHAIRHRYFNKTLSRAVNRPFLPAKQVIILGAGFDTRPLRKQHYAVKFFEIDQPAVINYKQNIYTKQNISFKAVSIGMDYTQENFMETLISQGLNVTLPTHIIWEGNVVFLSLEKIQQVLHQFKTKFQAPVTLSFDYHADKTLRRETGHACLTQLLDTIKEKGASFVTGIDNVQAFAETLGMKVLDNYTVTDLIKIYGVDNQPTSVMEYYSCCTIEINPILSLQQRLASTSFFLSQSYTFSFSQNSTDLAVYFKLCQESYQEKINFDLIQEKNNTSGRILLAKNKCVATSLRILAVLS